jgi:hypothetical protein
MQTRGRLSDRHGAPIRIPLRPTPNQGLAASSIQVDSALLSEAGAAAAAFDADLQIQNLERRTIEARLSFAPEGRQAASGVILSLGPLESVEAPNALRDWFRSQGESGALSLVATDGAPALIQMTARAYVREAADRAPLGWSRDGGTASRFATGLSETDDSQTEIQASNTTSETESFTIHLRSSVGSLLGVREGLSLAPGESGRWTLRELFPEAFGEGLTVGFAPQSGSSLPIAAASVTDVSTGSLVSVAAERPASLLYLPVAGRTAGSGDTFLSSDATLANAGERTIEVRARFLQKGLDNTVAPRATLVLGAGEARPIRDVLSSLFGMTEVAGFLEVSSNDASVLAACRLTARAEGMPGMAGTSVHPILADRFSTRSVLIGAASSVGLLNPNATSLVVRLHLRDLQGGALGETSVVVPAGGSIEIPLAGLAGEAAAWHESGTILNIESDIRHFAYPVGVDSMRPRSGGVPPREGIVR